MPLTCARLPRIGHTDGSWPHWNRSGNYGGHCNLPGADTRTCLTMTASWGYGYSRRGDNSGESSLQVNCRYMYALTKQPHIHTHTYTRMRHHHSSVQPPAVHLPVALVTNKENMAHRHKMPHFSEGWKKQQEEGLKRARVYSSSHNNMGHRFHDQALLTPYLAKIRIYLTHRQKPLVCSRMKWRKLATSLWNASEIFERRRVPRNFMAAPAHTATCTMMRTITHTRTRTHINYVHAEPATCSHVACWHWERWRGPEEGGCVEKQLRAWSRTT